MKRTVAEDAERAAMKRVRRIRKTANKQFLDSFDTNGSYTGTPVDGGKPVQDVDDL